MVDACLRQTNQFAFSRVRSSARPSERNAVRLVPLIPSLCVYFNLLYYYFVPCSPGLLVFSRRKKHNILLAYDMDGRDRLWAPT